MTLIGSHFLGKITQIPKVQRVKLESPFPPTAAAPVWRIHRAANYQRDLLSFRLLPNGPLDFPHDQDSWRGLHLRHRLDLWVVVVYAFSLCESVVLSNCGW